MLKISTTDSFQFVNSCSYYYSDFVRSGIEVFPVSTRITCSSSVPLSMFQGTSSFSKLHEFQFHLPSHTLQKQSFLRPTLPLSVTSQESFDSPPSFHRFYAAVTKESLLSSLTLKSPNHIVFREKINYNPLAFARCQPLYFLLHFLHKYTLGLHFPSVEVMLQW